MEKIYIVSAYETQDEQIELNTSEAYADEETAFYMYTRLKSDMLENNKEIYGDVETSEEDIFGNLTFTMRVEDEYLGVISLLIREIH